MAIPHSAAAKDAPVPGYFPVNRYYIEDNPRAHSRSHSVNLTLEDFELELECAPVGR